MRMNLILASNNVEQAEKIRRFYFPDADSFTVRDSYIFGYAVDVFAEDIEDEKLEKYFSDDSNATLVSRMVTLKQKTRERLNTLAKNKGTSISAICRAIIAYTIDNLPEEKEEAIRDNAKDSKINELIKSLELQLKAADDTIKELKKLVK